VLITVASSRIRSVRHRPVVIFLYVKQNEEVSHTALGQNFKIVI
jgi:hypothetical protein